MHTTTYRSQIYFEGEMIDVAWEQKGTLFNGAPFITIISISCGMNWYENSVRFKQVLQRRSEQIREAENVNHLIGKVEPYGKAN